MSSAVGNIFRGIIPVTQHISADAGLVATHIISAASTNATSVKATPGQLLGWSFGNTNAAWRYVKLHNVAVTPTAGAGVARTIPIPPNGVSNVFIPGGITFSTGIGYTIVTGAADADVAAVGLNDVVGELMWV